MGSMSIDIGYRASPREARTIVDSLLAGTDEHPLIDKSGIMGWTRCWALYEPGNDPEHRYITLLQFDVSAEHFTYKYIDESMGPFELDCPQRLLKAVADYPPPNEFAAEWRREAWAYHNNAKAARRLLREVENNYPHGDRRLVVNGAIVSYERVWQNGRPRHAYRKVTEKGLWALDLKRVDVETTGLVRELPGTFGTARG